MSSISREGDGQVAVGSGAVTTYICQKAKASEIRGIGKILEMVAQTGRRDTESSIILLLQGSAGWYRVVSSKQGAGERAAQNFAYPLKCSPCPCTENSG